MPITSCDIARDTQVGPRVIDANQKLIVHLLTANPGVMGIYVSFIIFVSACRAVAADKEPLMEFLELLDVLEGVPPAQSDSRH
jgi:hypothetical protein